MFPGTPFSISQRDSCFSGNVDSIKNLVLCLYLWNRLLMANTSLTTSFPSVYLYEFEMRPSSESRRHCDLNQCHHLGFSFFTGISSWQHEDENLQTSPPPPHSCVLVVGPVKESNPC